MDKLKRFENETDENYERRNKINNTVNTLTVEDLELGLWDLVDRIFEINEM